MQIAAKWQNQVIKRRQYCTPTYHIFEKNEFKNVYYYSFLRLKMILYSCIFSGTRKTIETSSKIKNIDDLVRAMKDTAFGARTVGEAAYVLEKMCLDRDAFVTARA